MKRLQHLAILVFIMSLTVTPLTYAEDDEMDNSTDDAAPEVVPQDIYPPGCIPTVGLPTDPQYVPCIAYFPPELDDYYDVDEEVSTNISSETSETSSPTTTVTTESKTYYYQYPYAYNSYYTYVPGAFAIGLVYGSMWNAAHYNYNNYYWRGYSWNDYKAGTWNTYYGHGVYLHGPSNTGYCRNGVCKHWETGQPKANLESHKASYTASPTKYKASSTPKQSTMKHEKKHQEIKPHHKIKSHEHIGSHPRQGGLHRGGHRR